MPLEDILASIERAAAAEAEAVLEDARTRAAALLDDAREAAAAREEALAHAGDDRIRMQRRRTLSLAHLEAARARRDARERVYGRIVDRVVERLRSVPDEPGYREVLATLLDECVAVLPLPETVRVHPRDEALARELLSERGIDAPIEPLDGGWGGVEVEAEGTLVRNDLASRLDRAEGHLRHLAGEVHPPLRGGGR